MSSRCAVLVLLSFFVLSCLSTTVAIFVSADHPFKPSYTYCHHTSLGPWGGTAPFNLTIHSGLNTTADAPLLETLLLNSQQTSITNWVVDVPAGQDVSFVLTDRTGASLAVNSKITTSHEECDTLLLRNIKYSNDSVVLTTSSASPRSSTRSAVVLAAAAALVGRVVL